MWHENEGSELSQDTRPQFGSELQASLQNSEHGKEWNKISKTDREFYTVVVEEESIGALFDLI